MEVGHLRLLDRLAQLALVGGELDAVGLDDIRCAAYRRGAEVALLGHIVTRAGHHEAGAGGDVECVLAVAARTHDVDGIVGREVYGEACALQSLAESEQFVYGNAAGADEREHGAELYIVCLALPQVEDYGARLVVGERAAFWQS